MHILGIYVLHQGCEGYKDLLIFVEYLSSISLSMLLIDVLEFVQGCGFDFRIWAGGRQ